MFQRRTFDITLSQFSNGIAKRLFATATGPVTVVQKSGGTDRPTRREREGRPVVFRDYEIKITKLPSGLRVASLDASKDISRMSVVFNSGTRYEDAHNLGITQRLRQTFGLATTNLNGQDIGNLIGELGASFKVTATREHLQLSLECLRDYAPDGIEFLGELARPDFPNWSVSDNTVYLEDECQVATADPLIRVTDLLHMAAFGNSGLGNSLVVPHHTASHFTATAIRNYAKKSLTASTTGLFGVGIDHEELLRYATDHFHLNENSSAIAKLAAPHFRAGEARDIAETEMTYGALAAEGCTLQDAKAQAVQRVFAALLDMGPGIRGSTHGISLLDRSIGQALQNSYHVSALNMHYSDSGLFGFYFACQPQDAKKLMQSALSEVRKVSTQGPSGEDLERAKQHTLLQLLASEEHGGDILDDMSIQVMTTGLYTTPRDFMKLVTEVTAADVQKAAKVLLSKKVAMAAHGVLHDLPRLEELMVA